VQHFLQWRQLPGSMTEYAYNTAELIIPAVFSMSVIGAAPVQSIGRQFIGTRAVNVAVQCRRTHLASYA